MLTLALAASAFSYSTVARMSCWFQVAGLPLWADDAIPTATLHLQDHLSTTSAFASDIRTCAAGRAT